MNDQNNDPQNGPNEDRNDDRPVQQPAPEVHREREIIVTGSEGRGSGASTAIIVIFSIVALAIITFLAFTFLDRERVGDGILPGDVDITIEIPKPEDGS